MNVNSIKINNVYHNGEVDLDGLLPEAVEGLDTIKSLDENEEVLGAKNLLPLTLENLKARNTTGTWSGNAYTLNGVTFTVNTNSQGSVTDITVNGTKEESTPQSLFYITNSLLLENNINYWMTGGSTGIVMTSRYTTTPYDFREEQGSGIRIPFERERVVLINVITGTYTNVKIYPMIRLASDNNPTYRPYAMSNQELTQRLLSLEQRVATLEG